MIIYTLFKYLKKTESAIETLIKPTFSSISSKVKCVKKLYILKRN